MNDWTKIKNYYIHHNISYEKLAEKFKVSFSSVSKRGKRENWKQLKAETRKKIDKKVIEKTTESVVDEKVKANKHHTELYEKGLKVVELLLNQYLNELENETKGKPKATAYNMDFIMKAIATAQKGQRLSLKIDDDNSTDEKKEPEIAIIEGLDINKV